MWQDEARLCACGCGRIFTPATYNQRYYAVEHKWIAAYRRARDRQWGEKHITPRQTKAARLKQARRLYLRSRKGLTDSELAAALVSAGRYAYAEREPQRRHGPTGVS